MPKYLVDPDSVQVYEISKYTPGQSNPSGCEIIELSEEDAQEFNKACTEWEKWQDHVCDLVNNKTWEGDQR